ncbi:F-box only protein 2 [Spea bombifrons]|uniref:F-box only protein 2 n=1 Tax=Spea bombifrons TaxID=233779 RepID=UPI00234A58AB|nr:F-box only protein 2 [Spea bombifrons]XP_053307805.1 F-box only protein 2 [Spea bombifrons]XP_053307806.1 F-box only protein 2 [Spea bombifrons]
MESFPDPVLTQILAGLPAEELVLVCRLVCHQWKNIVDGAEIWRIKCRRDGLAETARDAERGGWKTSYFLHRRKKNLIRNHRAEEDLDSWEVVANGGDGWNVEELPGDNGRDFPIEGIRKYFATSFEWCSKAQVIDLLNEGYWEELLDTEQPNIVINDWYAARTDAGCLYELCAQLLSDDHQVITEYKSEMIAIPQSDDGEWTQISHTFSGYGPGVRYIRFQHGGQDSVFWKGWFGVRVTNSSVTIEP